MTRPRSARANAESDVERFFVWPHRSLPYRGALVLMGTIALLLGPFTVWAISAGAWPLALYPVLAILGFAWALYCSYRAARRVEVIELAPEAIRISEIGAAARGREPLELSPWWVRVVEAPGPWNETRLLLRQSGRSVAIGDFLSPDERHELAEHLRDTIARKYFNPC